jgi:hypothetical protein
MQSSPWFSGKQDSSEFKKAKMLPAASTYNLPQPAKGKLRIYLTFCWPCIIMYHNNVTFCWPCIIMYHNNITFCWLCIIMYHNNVTFCWPCIIMYHNTVTNLMHFHFHNHFVVSWSFTCFGRQASILRRHYTSSFWCELHAVVAFGWLQASVVPPEDGRLRPETFLEDQDTIKWLWKWKCIKLVTLLW